MFWAATLLATGAAAGGPPLILLGLDGFRWDYFELHRASLPNLLVVLNAFWFLFVFAALSPGHNEIRGGEPVILLGLLCAQALRGNGSWVTQGLEPVFLSKTFPNHFSLVTGLHTESHGAHLDLFPCVINA